MSDRGVPARRAAGAAIEVLKITVLTGRLVCDLRIADESLRYATPGLAAAVVRRFPTVPDHACVNGSGPTFAHVMDSASVPHLLEHVVIELQTRASADPGAAFAGTTEWVDERAGLARVQVSFCDDLQALRAFNEAVIFLNGAMLI